jgi:hypothetical protein
MRKIILLSMITFCTLSYGQTDSICGILPMKNSKICYEEVVVVDNLKATQLYSNAKIWIASTFGSAKSVIESDVENNSLVLKGFLRDNEFAKFGFNLTIQFKDGRYKYTLTDIYYYFYIEDVADIVMKMEDGQAIIDCNKPALKAENLKFKKFTDNLKNGINLKNDW